MRLHGFRLVMSALAALPLRADDTPRADASLTGACLAQAGDEQARRACVGVAAEACIATPDGDANVGMGWCLESDGDGWEARRAAAAAAWAAWRDADGTVEEAFWAGGSGTGGSGTGSAVAACRTTLTAERALRLERPVADYGAR